MTRTARYDAVVVGAGPNGLSAAIAIAEKGHSVLVLEGQDTVGGGARSAALTLPGFLHDVCSAVHPMAVSSPFLSRLPLQNHRPRLDSASRTPRASSRRRHGGNAGALG